MVPSPKTKAGLMVIVVPAVVGADAFDDAAAESGCSRLGGAGGDCGWSLLLKLYDGRKSL